jgi:hypothetical protein
MLLLMLRVMLLGMPPLRLLKPLLLKVGTCWESSARTRPMIEQDHQAGKSDCECVYAFLMTVTYCKLTTVHKENNCTGPHALTPHAHTHSPPPYLMLAMFLLE